MVRRVTITKVPGRKNSFFTFVKDEKKLKNIDMIAKKRNLRVTNVRRFDPNLTKSKGFFVTLVKKGSRKL